MVVRVHGGVINDQMLAGSLRYFDIEETNMTVNTIADGNQRVIAAEVVAPGSNYLIDDVLTVVDGTGTAATLTVSILDGTGVDGAQVTTAGDYSVLPTNPVSVTGGAGTLATFNLTYTSTIIIPGAGVQAGTEYYVGIDKPVTNSAVDQVLRTVQAGGADGGGATIVQVGIVSADTVRIAIENTGFGWDTEAAGDAAAEMEDAIQALGIITVPDTTTDGLAFDLSLATVTERTFASFT